MEGTPHRFVRARRQGGFKGRKDARHSLSNWKKPEMANPRRITSNDGSAMSNRSRIERATVSYSARLQTLARLADCEQRAERRDSLAPAAPYWKQIRGTS